MCVGDWLPTSVFGYLHALCAYLRMIYVALYLIFLSGVEYDVVFCDQVSFVFRDVVADTVWLSIMTSPVCAAVFQRIAHIVNSSCHTALLVSHPLTTIESYVISTIGFIMYYLVLFYLLLFFFVFFVVLLAVIFPCCSSMKEATQERLSYLCQSRFLHLQVSACIPVLRLSRHTKKVLFYCHFPDQLLTQRKSTVKKLYRAPIDWVEERTTGMADMVGDGLDFGLSVISVDCTEVLLSKKYYLN